VVSAESFKKQFLPHSEVMYRAAYRLLGNAQDAEDMVQEAFIRLWEKRETAMQADNAEAYCVALTKNLCIDRLRLKRLNYANTPPENLDLPDESNLLHSIERRDQLEVAQKALDMLPKQQQEVVKLYDFEGRSVKEIQVETGLTNVNIRVLLSRAHQKLKNLFNNEE
jgi:RNA polymerase sigma-70 factor (ECF subfamily)